MININPASCNDVIGEVKDLEKDVSIIGSGQFQVKYLSVPNDIKENSIVWIGKASFLNLKEVTNSIVILHEKISQCEELNKIIAIVSKNPRLLAAKLYRVLGAEQLSYVQKSVVVKNETPTHDEFLEMRKIGIEIERGVKFGGNVRLYGGAKIGEFSNIGANSVIGAQGFSFVRDDSGIQERFPHFGSVIIGKNVEIGIGCSIDSGGLEPTIIGSGTKIGNFCQVAHNVLVGDHCQIAGCSQLGGGAVLEDFVSVGPGVLIANKSKISTKALIRAGSVVVRNVAPGQDVSGNFAMEHKQNLKRHFSSS